MGLRHVAVKGDAEKRHQAKRDAMDTLVKVGKYKPPLRALVRGRAKESKMEKKGLYIAGYWNGKNGAEGVLRSLGYKITGDDRGNDSFWLQQEHCRFFEYYHGTPECAGRLTYVGGAEEISAENLKLIRRRVEDALRKSGQEQILKCAYFLGVKLQ